MGGKSAGKTTILHFLAAKLLQSHLAVYSECLFCAEWNGEFLLWSFEVVLILCDLFMKKALFYCCGCWISILTLHISLDERKFYNYMGLESIKIA